MEGNPISLMQRISASFVAAVLFAGCSSLEKRVDLTYEHTAGTRGGSGEVYLAKAVVEQRYPGLPGGRVVLGTVKNSGTQIVTGDSLSRWVVSALMEELYSAGYEVRTATSLPEKAPRGVLIRVVRLSSNQDSDGLVLRTSTEIGLTAEIWKKGRLVKTLTTNVGSQEQGIDRSGAVVSASLRANLQSALSQLMPGIVDALEG